MEWQVRRSDWSSGGDLAAQIATGLRHKLRVRAADRHAEHLGICHQVLHVHLRRRRQRQGRQKRRHLLRPRLDSRKVLVQRLLSPADRADVSPRRVGGDHREAARLCELDERPVVGDVVCPRARVLQHVLLADGAGEVLVEDELHVALEHLQRENDLRPHGRQRDEEERLEVVRDGVVVALPQEHDVARRRLCQQLRQAALRAVAAKDAEVLRPTERHLRQLLRKYPRPLHGSSSRRNAGLRRVRVPKVAQILPRHAVASLRRSDKERHRRGDVTLDPHPFDQQLSLHEVGRHVLLHRRRLKARVCPAVVFRQQLRHAAQVVQHADLVQRLRVPRCGHLLQQRHALCSALLIQVPPDALEQHRRHRNRRVLPQRSCPARSQLAVAA
mmetsp:Transcript_18606/g.59491  ORF Transcript_18606/g.59491 Transcript_18606/m.59491 type:complete len:386 (+) Transcript_18606:488-1645(+)